MNFGQAFEDAGALLALLGMIPVALLLIVMSQNIGNPEFDMLAATEAGILGVVEAIRPAIFLTGLLAVGIWLAANAQGGR